MLTTQVKLQWDKNALEKFQNVIRTIPLFHRQIALQVVEKKAEENAQMRGSSFVEEDDILKAFFSEVPKAFYSLMVRLLEQADFNYKKYSPRH